MMITANQNNVTTFPPYIFQPSKNTTVTPIKSRLTSFSSFRLIETVDASLEIVMAAEAINASLKKDETVVLVSPEKSEQLMRKLAVAGVDVELFFQRKKLIIFSSHPAIAGNLSLATDYREVFDELLSLAEYPVDHIIFLKIDLLVNLESQSLAYASVSKFTQTAQEIDCKIIAQYSRNPSEAHDRLDAACSSLVDEYLTMKCTSSNQALPYRLQAKMSPLSNSLSAAW
jgi:hypothetical protein